MVELSLSNPNQSFDSAEPDPSLDPADWEAYRAVCHQALDAALEFVRTVRERPVWQPIDEESAQALDGSLPLGPEDPAALVETVRRHLMPFANGNLHPRFFGWVHGAGTAGGMIADMLAAAINSNCGGRDHAAIHLERQVLRWCKTMLGWPETGSGLLVSGSSIANLIALHVARHHHAGYDVRAHGQDGRGRLLVGYTSRAAHACVAKAFELLGLGRRALRRLPTDTGGRLDLAALQLVLDEDRRAGLQPFCVIATAGTVNTGAIDPLERIADLCAAEDLWLHVDGAFGALAALSPRLRPLVRGLERADSLAFDFHKWLHVPYDAGCVLVRSEELHRRAFASQPDYLAGAMRGLAAGTPWFCDYGPELSRGCRALKVWWTLKEHGVTRLAQAIERNCAQARYLAERVRAEPSLELLAPAALNIVCFRYAPHDHPEVLLDELNQAIVEELQEQGIAAPSTTRLDGRLAIRVNLTNHRTRQEDLDLLVEAVLTLGAGRC